MTSFEKKVIVNGAPEYCGLGEIQKKIGATFRRDQNPVVAVKRCKDQHGINVPGNFEIELEDSADVEELLKTPRLALEFEDELKLVIITRLRPRAKPRQAPGKPSLYPDLPRPVTPSAPPLDDTPEPTATEKKWISEDSSCDDGDDEKIDFQQSFDRPQRALPQWPPKQEQTLTVTEFTAGSKNAKPKPKPKPKPNQKQSSRWPSQQNQTPETTGFVSDVYENVPPRPPRTGYNIQNTYANEPPIVPARSEQEEASSVFPNEPPMRRQTPRLEPAFYKEENPSRPPRNWPQNITGSRSHTPPPSQRTQHPGQLHPPGMTYEREPSPSRQGWTQPAGSVFEEVPPQRSQHNRNPSSSLRRDNKSPSPSKRAWEHPSGSMYDDEISQSQHVEPGGTKLPLVNTTLHDMLQEDAIMFESYKDNCVLIQTEHNNDPKSFSQVVDYFDRNKKWRPLKSFLLEDGCLMVYKSKHLADEIAETCFSIPGCKARACRKPLPPVFKDRFLVKSKSTVDDIKGILESCVSQRFDIKKLRGSDHYLVTFKTDIDIDTIQDEIAILGLPQHEELQIVKVCRTDCIKIQNLPQTASETPIKVSCMKKDYDRKGEVTRINFTSSKNKTAYVYFSNYQDAEAVAQKKEITVAKQAVQVSLHWTAVKGSLEPSSGHFNRFFCSLDDFDTDIVNFVRKSRQHNDNFQQELHDLAKVEIVSYSESENAVKVIPVLTPDQFQDNDQDEFEHQCNSQIRQYFGKFKSFSRSFFEEDKLRVRKAYGWDETEGFVDIENGKQNIVNVFVRWELNDRALVKVTGLSSEVDFFFDWFYEQCKQIQSTVALPNGDLDVLNNCAILENLIAVFSESVEVTPSTNNEITLSGSKETVKTMRESIKKALKRVKKQETSAFLHPAQQQFISKSLQRKSHTGKPDIVNFLQDYLTSQHIKVTVQHDGKKLNLVYTEKGRHDLQRAQEELKDLLKYETITVESGYDNILKESDWKNLQQNAESNGELCILQDNQSSTLTVVGLQSTFDQQFNNISAYMANNVETEYRVDMTYSQTMFFCEQSSKLGVENNIPDSIDWYKEPGGICLKGRLCQVQKAVAWITEISRAFFTMKKVLDTPGITDYFLKPGAQQFLERTSKETCSFIKLKSDDTDEWIDARKVQKIPSLPQQNLNVVQHGINTGYKGGISQQPTSQVSGHPKKFQKIPVPIPQNTAAIQVGTNLGQSGGNFQQSTTHSKGILSSVGKVFGNVGKWIKGSVDITLQQEQAVQVKVLRGDILKSQCEVMINTTDNEFDLTTSKVSEALLKIAGVQMLLECKQNPIVQNEIIRVTTAPNLAFQYVLHLATPADRISAVLVEAFKTIENNLGCRSVALPAIGTGKLKNSYSEAARFIRKAIDEFRKTDPTVLKRIEIVIYEQKMLATFEAIVAQSRFAASGAGQPQIGAPQPVPVFHQKPVAALPIPARKSKIVVNVNPGDILKSNCEVLINTTGSDYDLTASQLSKKLLQQGGNSISDECKSSPVLTSQQYRVTSGGSTQFHNIVHFVTPNLDQLARELEVVLIMVNDQLKKNSIAIPAIGTGAAGLPADQVALAFCEAVSNFRARNLAILVQVDVVVYEQNMLSTFQNALSKSGLAQNVSATSAFQTAQSQNLSKSLQNIASLPPKPPTQNKVVVNVIQGDILKSGCRVLINTTGGKFDLTASILSKKLLQQGGNSISDECKSNPTFQTSLYRVTSGGSTQFQYIVHFVTPTLGNLAKELEDVLVMVNDQLNEKSIAIPAIGTGGAGMAEDKVAEAFNQAISNFRARSPTQLNQIDVVIFQQKMYAPFHNALSGGGSSIPSPGFLSGPNPTAPPMMARSNNVTVNVTSGDILKSNCEVLINTTGDNFDLTASQLSKLLLQHGGKKISDECKSKPVFTSKHFRITKGGSTQFRYIVHFVTPNIGMLAQRLKEVFDVINDELKISSLAIPAIGTGAANLPQDQVAQAFKQAIDSFTSSNPQHLKKIDVVIYQQQMLSLFQSNIKPPPILNVPPQKIRSAFVTSHVPKSKSRLRFLNTGTASTKNVELFITTNSQDSYQKALAAIQEKADSKCTKKLLHDKDKVLDYFDDKDLDQLKDIGKEFNVYLRVPQDDSENKIEILGPSKNVHEAFSYAITLLEKYNKAVAFGDFVTWYYEDPGAQTWIKFDLVENYEVHNLFKDKKSNTTDLKIKINGRKQDMWFDFRQMTMSGGGNTMKIKKIAASEGQITYPNYWDGTKSRQLVQVLPNTTEFKAVVSKYKSAGLNVQNVIQLQRVENKRLYTQFLAQKQAVEERMNSQGVTKELFHGTSKETCDLIYKGGFDRSYAGDKVGTKFGFGVYFATTASYSHRFADQDSNGHQRIFLADVITGQYTQGDPKYKVPPLISGTTDCHDSVVDNPKSPTMYVVFKDASVYPLYILTYV